MASSETLSRPLSSVYMTTTTKQGISAAKAQSPGGKSPRPRSDGTLENEMPLLLQPSLPPKRRCTQYKSTGVLLPASGVARRIAAKAKAHATDDGVSSQSDSNLASRQSRRRNPFADSDDEDDEDNDEDDFVELSELPPLPQKHLPVLHPKQKINKSQSTRRRIDMALLAKYKTQPSSFNSSFEDYDMVDYDDPEKLAAAAAEVVGEEDEEQMDYDEPIPLHAHLL